MDYRQGHPGDPSILLSIVAAATLLYVVLALRQHLGARGWSGWRTASCIAGSALLIVGLLPRLLPFPDGDFRDHMLQHLLIGMIAPLGLVLSAPITLVLRSVPRQWARRLVCLLRTRFVRFVAHPVTALTLNIGGMGLLYFTPLYEAAASSVILHHWVHVHFLIAGCLFAWVIAGPDPAPHRPSVPYRLVVLGIAIFAHATLSQLMYAGMYVSVHAPLAELRGGAELMYYGGDIAELLLAFAMVSTWRPKRRAERGSSGAAAASTIPAAIQ